MSRTSNKTLDLWDYALSIDGVPMRVYGTLNLDADYEGGYPGSRFEPREPAGYIINSVVSIDRLEVYREDGEDAEGVSEAEVISALEAGHLGELNITLTENEEAEVEADAEERMLDEDRDRY